MRSLLFALLAVAVLHTAAHAQSCCSPSLTPSGAIAHHALRGGQWQAGLFTQHIALAGGRRGTESIPYPNERESDAQTLAGIVRAGVADWFSASVLVPFVWRERSDVLSDGTRVFRSSSGLGDVATMGYVRLLRPLQPREWTAGAGVKWATGESRAEDETGELPQELQPGTGANDLLLTTLYTEGLGSFTLNGGVTWRLTGILEKIDVFPGTGEEIERTYQFGNELLYGVSGAWTPDFRLGLELGVRGRHAQPDRETALHPDGTTGEIETLPSTGGEWIWLTPLLRYATPGGGLTASLTGLFPIYENLIGTQLSTEPGVQFSLEASF